MLAIGMDVHSSKITAHAVPLYKDDIESSAFAEDFNTIFRKFSADRPGLTYLAGKIRNEEHCILIENSTKTHEVYWILTDLGCTVMVAYSTDLFRITKSVKKTDEHDCVELAHYMRRRLMGEIEFAECLIVDRKWINRRQLCRIYAAESEQLSDTRRQIRSFMLLRGMNMTNLTRDIVSKTNLKNLEMNADDSMRILIDRARTSKNRMDCCIDAIKKEFKDENIYRLLMSIPGFGPITSAYVSSMIIDIGRFDTPNQFSAYFGIIPKSRESGDSAPSCGITRRGDETLRKMILQATFVHIKNDKDKTSPVSQMYERLRSRGLAHKKSITAAANKMTKIIYRMLKDGIEYKV